MNDRPGSDNDLMTTEELVDNALDESFPASDPPSYSSERRHREIKEGSEGAQEQSRSENEAEATYRD